MLVICPSPKVHRIAAINNPIKNIPIIPIANGSLYKVLIYIYGLLDSLITYTPYLILSLAIIMTSIYITLRAIIAIPKNTNKFTIYSGQ
mmetsp:Transcript_29725/g.5364  ORF Transcript_29725/g.5364 Transcript_29725/m.5364 type:complete len:89 (-) Transcript_29725:741-1007(-)